MWAHDSWKVEMSQSCPSELLICSVLRTHLLWGLASYGASYRSGLFAKEGLMMTMISEVSKRFCEKGSNYMVPLLHILSVRCRLSLLAAFVIIPNLAWALMLPPMKPGYTTPILTTRQCALELINSSSSPNLNDAESANALIRSLLPCSLHKSRGANTAS